jgi:cytochrome c biogenesis protein
LREGTGFSNVVAQYDTFTPGRLFKSDDLVPFNVQLDQMEVTFEQTSERSAKATDFAATLEFRESVTQDFQTKTIGVNNPLDIGNASMFLLGWGYAPHIIVRDGPGNIVFDDTVVFLPQDGNFTSTGVVKVPDMEPQLGIQGIFAPTAIITADQGPHSMYPDLVNPMIFASFWSGDLGLDNGKPQNIYSLDKTKLKRIGLRDLKPGETWELKNNKGSVEFVEVTQFATFNVASDPSQNWALLGAILAILGIIASLYIQRRRVWIRVVSEGGKTEVIVAAISRQEDVDLSLVVADIASQCSNLLTVPK